MCLKTTRPGILCRKVPSPLISGRGQALLLSCCYPDPNGASAPRSSKPDVGKMNKDKRCRIERFLNHTLEIIYLMTGEEYVIVKKNPSQNSIHLVTREVPIKCGDVSVYFSMEEWEYIEEHKALYGNVMTEKHPQLESTSMPSPEISGVFNEVGFTPVNSPNEDVQSRKAVQEAEILSDTFSDKKSVRGEEEDESQAFQYRPASRSPSEESHPSDVEEICVEPRFSYGMTNNENIVSYGFQSQDGDRTSPEEVPFPKIEDLMPPALSFQYEQTLCSVRSSLTDGCDALYHQQGAGRSQYDFNENCPNSHPGEQLRDRTDGDIYTRQCSFVLHQTGHAGGKVHECVFCGKFFAHKSSLIKHRKSHTGEKAHVCSECGKPFALKYNLVQHLRSHTGEKPYMCATCGKYFAYKSAYNQHQKTHNKVKSHTCADCGRCFTRKSTLLSHQSVHTQNISIY